MADATFTWIPTREVPTDYQVTQSSGIIFDTNGNLLIGSMHSNNEWNLFGGSPEEGESALDALLRECIEEGDVKIKNIHLLGVFHVHFLQNPNPKEGEDFYQARYIADIDELLPQTPDPDEKEITIWQRILVPAETITNYIDWGENGKRMFQEAIKLHSSLSQK